MVNQVPPSLQPLLEEGIIHVGDVAAVRLYMKLALREDPTRASTFTPVVWEALTRTLAVFRDQHTCVELSEHAEWLDGLRRCTSLVGTPSNADDVSRRPFILEEQLGQGYLYLHRSWAEERAVALNLRSRSEANLSVVTGGPGTGKTTTIAQELIELLKSTEDVPPVVALAAPTGKAAKRMSEAITNALKRLEAPERVRQIVTASPATTIHRLLGSAPSRIDSRFTYNAGNKLQHDIVIVDEVSMISVSMMFHLLDALRPDTRLILVGDPDQLASVEAGTVLADIVDGFGPTRIKVLDKQYRFKDAEGIINLSTAIRNGDVDGVFSALTSHPSHVTWIDPAQSTDDVNDVLRMVVQHAKSVMALAAAGKLDSALDEKLKVQVLCAHRNGRYGVAGWNNLVERRLGMSASNQWYVGRPIIVTRNDRITDLSNGDVGVVGVRDGGRSACFGDLEKSVPVARLPHVETVHALTIHKSQGSEYDHVVVVLPEGQSRILTRELFYTGVTRAVSKLTVIGSRESIESAVSKKIRRATGLAQHLRS